jgi:hypothetical protein
MQETMWIIQWITCGKVVDKGGDNSSYPQVVHRLSTELSTGSAVTGGTVAGFTGHGKSRRLLNTIIKY